MPLFVHVHVNVTKQLMISCEAFCNFPAGPDKWHLYFPSAKGSHQSPIDIVPKHAEFDPKLNTHPLNIHMESEQEFQIANTRFAWCVSTREASSCKSATLYHSSVRICVKISLKNFSNEIVGSFSFLCGFYDSILL